MQKKREMNITRNNYETFFLDYLESNLDENLVDEFLEFLQQNPDLKEELAMLDIAPIEPENAVFTHKEKLYKEKFDDLETFNHASIARVEGDLPESEKAEFDTYLLKNPEKQKEVRRFKQTKLQPDKTVVFAHKNKLYRRTLGKTIFLWSSRVAAVLVLALAIYFYIDQSGENIINETQLAVAKTESSGSDVKPETTKPPVEVKEMQTDPTQIIPKKKEKLPVKTKKEQTLPHPKKSLRETTKGRIEQEKIAEVRTPVEVPEKIGYLNAAVQTNNAQNIALASMTIKLPENYSQPEDEKLFAEVIKEKSGLDNISFKKITKAGLNLVSNISKEKFSYQINNEGEITELNFDSRLLAFSIPTNKPVVGE